MSKKPLNKPNKKFGSKKEISFITSILQHFVYLNKTTQHTGWHKRTLENCRIWGSFWNGRIKEIALSSSILVSNAIDSSLRNKYHTVNLLSLTIQFSEFPTISSWSSPSLQKLTIHSLLSTWLTNQTVRDLASISGSVRIFVNASRHEKVLEKNTFFFFADVPNSQYILIADMPQIPYLSIMIQPFEWKIYFISMVFKSTSNICYWFFITLQLQNSEIRQTDGKNSTRSII